LATIGDVAAKAGVSVATVSRVLNGKCQVSEERRRKVLKAVKELHYEPNLVGRMLRCSQSKTILVVFAVMLPDLIRGIKDAAATADYQVILQFCPGQPADTSQFVMLQRGMADGAILADIQVDDSLLADLYDHYPIVQYGETSYQQAHVVSVNNEEIAYRLTRHLIEQGRRRIGTVGIVDSRGEMAYFSRDRLAGARRALREAGLPDDPTLHIDGPFGYSSGSTAAERFLALARRPDAIFCFQDALAVGCIQVLRKAGLRIPDDIAVAGFDNTDVSRVIDPPLTTVDQPFYEIGLETVRTWLLVQSQGNRAISRQVRLDARMLLRESTEGRKN
jgi:LacI family transcriptional regulator, repressor for deo operon, udp, cdd, tsx, nupC, and nupG